MLTNECWLGYHDNCELGSNCDCMCHDDWEWEDAYSDGPTIQAMAQEVYEALKKDGWYSD